jgi:hypothetical protein
MKHSVAARPHPLDATFAVELSLDTKSPRSPDDTHAQSRGF